MKGRYEVLRVGYLAGRERASPFGNWVFSLAVGEAKWVTLGDRRKVTSTCSEVRRIIEIS